MKEEVKDAEWEILKEEIVEIDLRGYQELSQLFKEDEIERREKLLGLFTYNRLEYYDEEKSVRSEYVLREKEEEVNKLYCRMGRGNEERGMVVGEGGIVRSVNRKYREEAELKREKKKRKKRVDSVLRNEIKQEEREYLQGLVKREQASQLRDQPHEQEKQ